MHCRARCLTEQQASKPSGYCLDNALPILRTLGTFSCIPVMQAVCFLPWNARFRGGWWTGPSGNPRLCWLATQRTCQPMPGTLVSAVLLRPDSVFLACQVNSSPACRPSAPGAAISDSDAMTCHGGHDLRRPLAARPHRWQALLWQAANTQRRSFLLRVVLYRRVCERAWCWSAAFMPRMMQNSNLFQIILHFRF